mmetsp:Transcript_21819/g.56692  ORF Transcript_21819/g.56692 Transcript_21819/m.56692 type:complete len:134 (+) Transcript_21819:1306-1707(+)
MPEVHLSPYLSTYLRLPAHLLACVSVCRTSFLSTYPLFNARPDVNKKTLQRNLPVFPSFRPFLFRFFFSFPAFLLSHSPLFTLFSSSSFSSFFGGKIRVDVPTLLTPIRTNQHTQTDARFCLWLLTSCTCDAY